MRYVWAIVCALMISTPTAAISGGMSGGTGIGGLIEEITEELQALLKHPIKIDSEMVRRILMRLWVFGQAEVKIGDKNVLIKWKIKKNVSEDPNQVSVTVIAIDASIIPDPALEPALE